MKAGPQPFDGKSPREKREVMKERTKRLALGIIELSHSLPPNPAIRIIRDQLLRSATGVAANYRAACRARSRKEFVAKIGVVIEECDETQFWLEILEAQRIRDRKLDLLLAESGELVSIFVASRLTAEKSPTAPNRQSAIGNRQ